MFRLQKQKRLEQKQIYLQISDRETDVSSPLPSQNYTSSKVAFLKRIKQRFKKKIELTKEIHIDKDKLWQILINLLIFIGNQNSVLLWKDESSNYITHLKQEKKFYLLQFQHFVKDYV